METQSLMPEQATVSRKKKEKTQEEQDETLSGTRLLWKDLPSDGRPTKRRASYIAPWETGLLGEMGKSPT